MAALLRQEYIYKRCIANACIGAISCNTSNNVGYFNLADPCWSGVWVLPVWSKAILHPEWLKHALYRSPVNNTQMQYRSTRVDQKRMKMSAAAAVADDRTISRKLHKYCSIFIAEIQGIHDALVIVSDSNYTRRQILETCCDIVSLRYKISPRVVLGFVFR